MSLNDSSSTRRSIWGTVRPRRQGGAHARVTEKSMRDNKGPQAWEGDDDMGLGWHLRRVGGVMTAAHGGTLGHILLLELGRPQSGVAI